MEFPLKNPQLPARLTGEDLEFLNELIPELFPDRDLTNDKTLTGREVVMQLAETAALKLRKVKQSKPEDLSRINELESELEKAIKDLAAADENYNSLLSEKETTIKELSICNEELETLNVELTEQLSGISTEKNEVSEKVRTLEKYVPVPNEMRIVVDPLTLEVLNLYAEKIRTRQKVDINGGKILLTLFNRYITKQETQLPGFPFLVSRQEIAQLAKKISE